MLDYHVQKSMDRILEGVDNGDTSLILESTNEFKAAVEALDASVKEFAKIIGAAGIVGLREPYEALAKQVAEVATKINEVGNEFSYADQMKMLKEPSNKPEAALTSAAMNHDTNVNAVKDGIIGIATWLDSSGKGIFTVGGQGVQLNPKFKECLRTPFNLSMFALAAKDDSTKNALLHKLVGVDYGSVSADEDEDIEKDVKQGWSSFYNPDGKEGDEESKRWKEFKELMFNLAGGAEDAWKAAGKAIQEGKPSPEFQKQAEGFGSGLKNFVGGLFKGKSDGKIDAKSVMGSSAEDSEGLMAIDFEKFGALVGQLIEMSKKATEVAEQSGEAVEAQQEATAPSDVVDAFKQKLADALDDTDLDNPESETLQALKTLETILGKPPTEDDIKKIDNLPEKLDEELKDPQKVNQILQALGIDRDSETEDSEVDENPNVKEFSKDVWKGFFGKGGESKLGDGTGEVIGRALKDLGYLNLTESIERLNEGFVEDLIAKVEEYTDIDDALKKAVLKKLMKQGAIDWIKGKLELDEEEELQESIQLINRWGQLAGIIKG